MDIIMYGLVPRPLPFLPSVWVHNNTQEQRTVFRRTSAPVHCCEHKRKVKTGEAWERSATYVYVAVIFPFDFKTILLLNSRIW